MAWSATAKASASSSTDANSYATGSHTPAASRVLVAVVQNDKATTPDLPTVSGNGLTWSLLTDGTNSATIVKASGTQFRLSVLAALTGGSPSAGAVTADFGGVTQLGCIISVFELEIEGGVPASLAALVRQVKTGEDGVSGTLGSLTLDVAMLSTSRGISAFVHNINESVSPRANWTEIHDLTHGAPVRGLDSQYRLTAAEDTASASWASTANWLGVFIELKETGAGTSVAIAQATETDTAGTVTPGKAKDLAQASETDTAGTVTPAKSVAIGQAVETDTAGSIAPAVEGGTDVDIGQATETDTAQPIIPAKAVVIGQVVETDTAQPVTVAKAVLIGLATDTETVGPFTVAKTVLIGQALETDTAFDVVPVAGEARDVDWVFLEPTSRWATSEPTSRWTTGAPTL